MWWPFRKKFTLSLNRVHDRVRISEGDDSLTLLVDDDPMRLTAGIGEAVKLLRALNDKSSEEDGRKAAEYFAGVIFGSAPARALMAFYHQDASCVIAVCGQYVEKRLSGLITAAQKKQ